MTDDTEKASPEPTTTETPALTDQEAIAAFDASIAEAEPKEEPKPSEPEKADPEPAAVEPEKVEPEADEPDAVESEIASLNLKEQAAARFRELSARPSEQDLIPVRAMAKEAEQMRAVISDSRANSQQLSTAFGYLKAINSGDPRLMAPALDSMVAEVQWLAKQLGRDVPGFHDPLGEHKDLAAEVEAGDLSRQRALEIAQQRTMQARDADFTKRKQDEEAQTRNTESARENALSEVQKLGAKLRGIDANFEKKMAMLSPTLDVIFANVPPQQWAQAAENAYLSLPQIANPAPAKAPISPMPLRSTGTSAGKARVPQTDMEAFEMGVASLGA